MKCVAKWCWSVADRRLGYSLCLCLCLDRVLQLDVKCVARGLAYSLSLCLFRVGVKCVAKWCWIVADRKLGYGLCLCLCL